MRPRPHSSTQAQTTNSTSNVLRLLRRPAQARRRPVHRPRRRALQARVRLSSPSSHSPINNLPSLQETDRDTLKKAAKQFSTYAGVGSILGLALGVTLAYRIRSLRTRTFAAFRAAEKPTHVRFANGREEAIPDVTPLMQPSLLGDVATYTFFAAGGVFVFGELGMLGGSLGAARTISSDPESKRRIETAFKKFRADVLRKEADALDRGEGGVIGL